MKYIDYNQIRNNLELIKKTNDVVLVVKNNAYGFNVCEIVNIARSLNINEYAVNTIAEAIELRKLTNANILLFGYSIDYIDLISKYNIIPCANSIMEIDLYTKNNIIFALEIDAGMNRFGIKNFNEKLLNNRYLKEIFAHFHNDNIDYNLINYIMRLAHNYNKEFHFGGSKLYSKINSKLRIGKIVYQDSLFLFGRVVMIKQIEKGESVGYDSLYTADKTELIAVVDVGYYNGLRVGYNGDVVINHKRYKIVGKICMNHTFVLIDDNVAINDKVEFLGKNIKMDEFLKNNNMSEYECFLSIR